MNKPVKVRQCTRCGCVMPDDDNVCDCEGTDWEPPEGHCPTLEEINGR